jgi:hypothetical protein
VGRESYFGEQLLKFGLVPQIEEYWIAFDLRKAIGMLIVSRFQILESFLLAA